MIDLVFRAADAAEPPAADLIEAMILELAGLYGRIDAPGTPSAGPAVFRPPHGTFLVGWCRGRAVAGGGIKRLDPETAEIKRMYVDTAWRGRGVAGQLLAALEDAARHLGYRRARLDTGRHQTTARALYERSGYRTIPDYNGNPLASYWGEKDLL